MVDSFVLESEKYRIEKELGRGGMGVVYLAEDVLLRRTVALKVLYEHLNRDSSFVKRFQKEAQSVSSLRHPNIVFVHGAEVVGKTFLIDMEYVDGLSLDKFSRSSSIAPPVVARIAGDILGGLAACHGAGVIHRDIKPANILLDRDGAAKIADFGLATAYAGHLMDSVKSKSTSGFFMGTPRYAPPAAWDGLEPQPEWDLYSLGVMLFELLSGKVAYPGETPMAIMRQHLTAPLPDLADMAPGVSPELAALVDALLDCGGESPNTSASEALERLQTVPEYTAVTNGETARTVKVALRKHRFQRGGRTTAHVGRRVLYAAAAILLLGGAAYWLAPLFPAAPATTVSSLEPAAPLDGPIAFLRPESLGGAGEEDVVWMFTAEDSAGGARVISQSPLGVDYMGLIPAGAPNRFTVTGGWGEFLSPAKGGFRYGTIAGEALLDRDGNSVTVSIEKTNSRDGSTVSHFLVAKPFAGGFGRRDFIQRLESSTPIQYMIHNELMPRRLDWAMEVESLMPAFEGGRLAVPSADTAIVVDGIPDEPVWAQAFEIGPREKLIAGSANGTLKARWSESAVLLGFSADVSGSPGPLEIILEPGNELPSGSSRQFNVVLEESRVVAAESRVGTQPVSWRCDWEVATGVWKGQWHAEVRIPVSEFGALGIPYGQRRWRLSASLRNSETDRELVYWGNGDLDSVEHGLILVFEEVHP